MEMFYFATVLQLKPLNICSVLPRSTYRCHLVPQNSNVENKRVIGHTEDAEELRTDTLSKQCTQYTTSGLDTTIHTYTDI